MKAPNSVNKCAGFSSTLMSCSSLCFSASLARRRLLADPQRSDGRVFSLVILQLPPDLAFHAPRNFWGSLVGEKRFVERVVFDVDRDFQKRFVLHRFLAFLFRRSQSHE